MNAEIHLHDLEIIGEATEQVPQPFREEHPELPWRLMAGRRERLIHDYGGVDYEIVWQTITDGRAGPAGETQTHPRRQALTIGEPLIGAHPR